MPDWNSKRIPANELKPGDLFAWTGDEWICREDPDLDQEPGFVWIWAEQIGGGPMNCRIGVAETVLVRVA